QLAGLRVRVGRDGRIDPALQALHLGVHVGRGDQDRVGQGSDAHGQDAGDLSIDEQRSAGVALLQLGGAVRGGQVRLTRLVQRVHVLALDVGGGARQGAGGAGAQGGPAVGG